MLLQLDVLLFSTGVDAVQEEVKFESLFISEFNESKIFMLSCFVQKVQPFESHFLSKFNESITLIFPSCFSF